MDSKQALLVVSFGTSYKETRKNTIERIEEDLKAAFPERTFFRAWTSGFLRKKVKNKEGLDVFSVAEALETILLEGYEDILIQPTLILTGGEFQKIREAAEGYSGKFKKIRLGRPLLDSAEDVEKMVSVLKGLFKEQAKDAAVIFMGHGSDTGGNRVYSQLNQEFEKAGWTQAMMATVEAEPGIDDVLETIKKQRPAGVILTPFLIVAGDHALNDMSGEEEESWKNRIAAEGVNVTCVVKGMGEYRPIRELFVEKAKEA